MNAVPVNQALFWPEDSPVSSTGEVDWQSLARGLARADYRGLPRVPGAGPFRGGERSVQRRRYGARPPYSRAQHAVLASRGVETLAVLNLRQRRVLAMHVGLAQLRQGGLDGAVTGGKKRLGLRFMELEALADVLACTTRWDTRPGAAASPCPGAVAADNLLSHLAAMKVADRKRVALHALFSELLPAGLGVFAADAALRAAGLHGEAPEKWVRILLLVRRMAEETVRRDVPAGPCIERTGFPALAVRIEPMAPEAAARLWLERYRVLGTGAPGGKTRKDDGDRQ